MIRVGQHGILLASVIFAQTHLKVSAGTTDPFVVGAITSSPLVALQRREVV